MSVAIATLATQSPSPNTTVILGRVVEGLSATTVADALVRVRGLAEPYLKASALTDDTGNFVFLGLPEGRYEFTASKTGYWSGEYSQLRAGGRGRVLVVSTGQRQGDLRVPVWKSAAISGTVLDEIGEPVVGLTVQAMGLYPAGGRLLVSSASQSARTDDRGMYRIFSVTPGEYVVSIPAAGLAAVAPQPARRADPAGDFAYPLANYPSGALTGADSVLALTSGEERRGVDFRLQLVRTRRIAGRVTRSADLGGIRVRLLRQAASFTEDLDIDSTTTDPDGAFTFDRVVPGDYVLRVFEASEGSQAASGGVSFQAVGAAPAPVRPQRAVAAGSWAELPISVTDANLDHVSLDLHPVMRIKGQVVLNGSAPKPLVTMLTILLTPTLASGRRLNAPGRAEVDAEFRFRTAELAAGQYFLRWPPGQPAGWFIESITIDGRDAFDQPITLRDRDADGVVITLTDKVSEISGIVRTDKGTADPDASVVVFPADPAKRIDFGRDSPRLLDARVDLDGRYSVKGIPPGDYLVAAVNDAYADRWQTQAFLGRISPSATKVVVTAGGKHTADLRTTSIR